MENNHSGYIEYRNRGINNIYNLQNKKFITVHRINSGKTTLNSPIIKRKRLSSENILNSYRNNEMNGFIYKKTQFVKPKSIYQSQKKLYNLENDIIIDNNTYNIRNENISTFFISSIKNFEENYINKKTLKSKKIFSPICQLYYMNNNNNIRNNIFNKKNFYNNSNYNENITKIIDTKFKRNNTSFYFKIKKENNTINNINDINTINTNDTINTIYTSNTINTNTINKKNHPIKIKLMNSSSSTALSFSENNYNLNNNIKNKNLKNNNMSNSTIDYSYRSIPYIYKKAIIKDFDYYSYDDIKMKEKQNENSNNLNNNNNKTEDIPLVTFGNPINDNNNNKKIKNENNNDKFNNKNNNKYILKLKRENEILKNELFKRNEEISLLENKIGNLIVEKKINTSHIKTKTKSYTYRIKNRLNEQCLIPTSYEKRFSHKTFIPKKENIKESLKTKEKIKPVIDRIFRNYKKREKNTFKNKDIKDNKDYAVSPQNPMMKSKILIENKKNKVHQEFRNQIENFII